MWNASGTLTDPAGGVTPRTYTAIDQVASVTDPLGRVTTATYDPAGRQLSQTDRTGGPPPGPTTLRAGKRPPRWTVP
ncbi:hypothetical protein CGK93_07360 [Arthrobacter sp. YN]|nr:hypothetical protein CGK93_07360 [Arthrobacter sp. YN]